MLVTALNSAPVIFYPTDTFAELEPCSPVLFRTAIMLYACNQMAAKPLDHIHIVGIVAEWLVAVLETYAHAVRVPERNKTSLQPLQALCRNAAVGAGGQTETEAWRCSTGQR